MQNFDLDYYWQQPNRIACGCGAKKAGWIYVILEKEHWPIRSSTTRIEYDFSPLQIAGDAQHPFYVSVEIKTY